MFFSNLGKGGLMKFSLSDVKSKIKKSIDTNKRSKVSKTIMLKTLCMKMLSESTTKPDYQLDFGVINVAAC